MSFSRSFRSVAAAAVVGGTALWSAAPAAHASPATPSDSAAASMAPKVLASDVVYRVSHLESLYGDHATPAGTVLNLGVTVADPDPAAITAFIDGVNTRGSADYRDFLTPAEFGARFGPAAATVTAVERWLQSGGLHVYTHSDTPGYVTATGTVAQIGGLMHTSFVALDGKNFLANTVAPTVPSAVLDVAGLNTAVLPRIDSLLPNHTAATKPTRAGSTDVGDLTPQDLWSVYDQPAADEGQGQGLALFGLGSADFGSGNTVESDLRDFEASFDLPQIPYSVKYFESSPTDTPTDTSGEVEWILDAQAADGMAPDAHQLVDYFGAGLTDTDGIGSYNLWADDPNGPLQGSTSWGSCEDVPDTDSVISAANSGPTPVTYLGNPNQTGYEQAFAQLAAEGRTLFSASGDTGMGCGLVSDLNGVTVDPTPVQNYPGVSPNVVGVGGSVLYFDDPTSTTPASRVEEYPWPYSSGGRSFFEPAPTWQAQAVQPVSPAGTSEGAGLPVDPYTNYVTYEGTPSSSGFAARLQPDVADLSGDIISNGYYICESPTEATPCTDSEGGTSLASPLWLGMWARVNALEPANTQGQFNGLGFAEATIYQLASAADYPTAYYDLGNPSENPPSVPNTNLSNAPLEGGYDTQTGWGVLNVKSFATLATGSTTFIPVNPSGQNAGGVGSGQVPESPLAVALPIAGVAIAGGLLLTRSRRRRRL